MFSDLSLLEILLWGQDEKWTIKTQTIHLLGKLSPNRQSLFKDGDSLKLGYSISFCEINKFSYGIKSDWIF